MASEGTRTALGLKLHCTARETLCKRGAARERHCALDQDGDLASTERGFRALCGGPDLHQGVDLCVLQLVRGGGSEITKTPKGGCRDAAQPAGRGSLGFSKSRASIARATASTRSAQLAAAQRRRSTGGVASASRASGQVGPQPCTATFLANSDGQRAADTAGGHWEAWATLGASRTCRPLPLALSPRPTRQPLSAAPVGLSYLPACLKEAAPRAAHAGL